MITKENFQQVLEALGFYLVEGSEDLYQNVYGETTDSSFELSVNLKSEQFFYPEEIHIERNTTIDFHQKESFVVFECIARLFAVGYRPENIWLEGKNYQGQGVGWIDVLVKDNTGVEYLIIECKTSDISEKEDEFSKHWKRTLANGDQLFRYFNTYSKAQYLCLYTADIVDEKLTDTYHLITLKDNEEYLHSDKKLKSYQSLRENQGSSEEFFWVWKNTYGQDISTNGMIEKDSKPFDIGEKKYSINDLKEIDSSSMQKKYNEFATILRKYNVSSKENAFDKLINLFLAKIVDETYYQSELRCLWRGAAYDNYYDLQDRLQALYIKGMKDFFEVEVAYVENKEIEKAFSFLKSKADEAKSTILSYFRTLKYYNNNPFAFLDVHNETLFYQNAIILKDIVNMIQDIKIKTEKQNQFLGDLFEGFLDQGIKQSEGQFFTPMPIVKFLISSLPLDCFLGESAEIPKVIDYACGAGHFLTEYANQIKPFVEKYKKAEIGKYYEQIHGIEKEYRLSKVSQVSAFMYGQDGIHIFYRDALSHSSDIQENSYSVLIANPPYSVKGFLQTLDEHDRKQYELFNNDINIDSNNSIETFFVERAKQLLKPSGIAAIILPSSVLSNGNIYMRCREIIFKHFDIVAIFESGSGTFGKTGTNTATLFLRKKAEMPSVAEHYKNRVEAWFGGNFEDDAFYEDFDFVERYCTHIGVNGEDYKTLLKKEPNDALLKSDLFANYIETLDVFSEKGKSSITTKGLCEAAKKIRTEIRNRVTKPVFKKLSASDQQKEVRTATVSFISEIEKEKLYYFMLLCANPQNVVCVKSPDKKSIKEFLGYEWSDTKGNEGIKYINVKVKKSDDDGEVPDDTIAQLKGIDGIQTPLFNPKNFDDKAKINTLIRANFEGKVFSVPENLAEYVKIVRLIDMVDFSRVAFDKAIKSNSEISKISITSKFPLVKLGEICNVKIGGTPSRNNASYFGGNNKWVSIVEMNGQIITDTKEKITDAGVKNSNVKLIPKGTTLLSFKLSIGKTAIAGTDLYTNEAIAALIPIDKEKISNAYLFHLFNGKMINLENVGNKVFGKSLNSTYLKEDVKIPLPPMRIQNKIVQECNKIDEEYNTTRMSIETYKAKVTEIFNRLEVIKNDGGGYKRIVELFDFIANRIHYTDISADAYISTDNLLQDCEGITAYEGIPNIDSVIEYQKDDILLSNIRPYLKKMWFADKNGGCSPDVLVLRKKENAGVLSEFAFYSLRNQKFFDFIMSDVKGMKMPRGKRETIEKYQFFVPSLDVQTKVVQQISEFDKKIIGAKKIMAECPVRKQAVLNKWLR